MNKELKHHGILGQKWGIRRYQNPDGTLTPAGRKRLEKKDVKWAKKNYDKIYNTVYKKSRKELNEYVENDLNKRMSMYTYDKNNRKRLSLSYVNEFNRKLSEIMTKNASDYSTPSGRAVKYIAKRGEVGAHMIISDQDFNIQTLKNGVYASGRIAYKKDEVNKA